MKKKALYNPFPMASVVFVAVLVVLPLGAIYTPQETITVAQATAAGLEQTLTPPDGPGWKYWNNNHSSFYLRARFNAPVPAGWQNVYGNHTVIGGHMVASLNLTGYDPQFFGVLDHNIHFALNITPTDLINQNVIGIRIDVPDGMRAQVKGIWAYFGPHNWVYITKAPGTISNESLILINSGSLNTAAATFPTDTLWIIFRLHQYPQHGDNYDFGISFYGDKGNYTGEYSGPFDNVNAKGAILLMLGSFQIFAALVMTDTIDFKPIGGKKRR